MIARSCSKSCPSFGYLCCLEFPCQIGLRAAELVETGLRVGLVPTVCVGNDVTTTDVFVATSRPAHRRPFFWPPVLRSEDNFA